MGVERKGPSKVTEGLNITLDGKSIFQENPDAGKKDGPDGPSAEDVEESPDVEEKGDELEE